MAMPPPSPPPPSSSAPGSDPLHPHLLPNTTIPLSSNPNRPFISSAISPSPTPLYTAQPLPVHAKAAQIHPSHLAKIQDSSPPPSVIPPPPQGIVFPVSANPRGFHPRAIRSSQPSDQMVTVANSVGYPLASGRNPLLVEFPGQVRAFGFSTEHSMRPPPPPLVQGSYVVPRSMGTANSGGIKGVSGIPHPKVNQPSAISSTSDYNSFKDLRDKSKDDAVVTINNRKVRLSDGGPDSLYALCRSWVRNGLPQESQPQFGDGIKLLPRPLPASMVDNRLLKRTEPDENEESSRKDEHPGSVENLSARDLLEGHIKRAKRIRAQLREERLQRIDRYKQRLALLLPPPVEPGRTDTVAPRS
ncbi:vegetative cell wall protein gp1-like [Magnolia sinica]|uniref:vegetative cell wall protein gp1-like n=1 Tax=Magnolia sinica TaxID=86752 RepID=UPI0026599996|nr:vegetative cell wall protein gp1-like [Magnolia sinica]